MNKSVLMIKYEELVLETQKPENKDDPFLEILLKLTGNASVSEMVERFQRNAGIKI